METSTKQAPLRDENGRLLPGNTANPNGRPKKDWTWAGLIIDQMDKVDETDPNKPRKVKEAVVAAVTAKALTGDVQAFNALVDRTDGKPKQPVVGGEDDDAPLNHKITVEFVRPQNDD